MRESWGSTKPTGAMKVKAASGGRGRILPSGRRTTGPSRLHVSEAEQERTRWDPKDGELCLSRMKSEETVAILTCKSIVELGYRGERLIEPSSSWFPPKFPSG